MNARRTLTVLAVSLAVIGAALGWWAYSWGASTYQLELNWFLNHLGLEAPHAEQAATSAALRVSMPQGVAAAVALVGAAVLGALALFATSKQESPGTPVAHDG